MKKITLLLLLCITTSYIGFAQCTSTAGGSYGSITVANDGSAEIISAQTWPNAEYSVVEGLTIGNSYTITGTNTTSVYITVTETTPAIDAIGTVITHGDASVSFTATTAQILVFWTLDAACNTQASDNTLTTIQCTTCTCEETAAPGALTNIAPLDMGTVQIEYNTADPTAHLVTPFSWEVSTTGGVATSYSLSLGTDTAGTNIGTLTGATNGNGITYSWADNTTYYWSVQAINCFGTTTSNIWSFTTGACTATAAPTAVLSTPIPATTTTVSLAGPDSSITFNWTGDINADETYILNIGTSPLNMQAFSDFQNGGEITGLAVSTIYFWRIDVVNCAGTTEGSVWSFTTDAELSTGNFTQENVFTHFLNQNTNVLTVTSANAAFDNITMYDILGKQVINKAASQTTETVNMSNLEDGIYILQVTIGGKTQTVKLLKQ